MIFFNSSNDNDNIDYERLRNDLTEEYASQMTSYSGGVGFCDMCDAENASNDELIAMAKREGVALRKYRKK